MKGISSNAGSQSQHTISNKTSLPRIAATSKDAEHQREKERIRRLKCKVLKLVELLRDRSSGHLVYVQSRMKESDFKVLEKRRIRESRVNMQASQVRLFYLGRVTSSKNLHSSTSTSQEQRHEVEVEAAQPITKPARLAEKKIPKPPPFFFGNPSENPPAEAIHKAPAPANLIDELVRHLTIEEIDTIAEDPVFYFPFREDGKYAEVQDVEKWNLIADTLTGRTQPRKVVYKPDDEQPGVQRLYRQANLHKEVPKLQDLKIDHPLVMQFYQKLERANQKHRDELEKVSLIAELSLQQQQARVRRNQKLLEEEEKKAQEKLLQDLQQKESSGQKAVAHQLELGYRRRRDNNARQEARLEKLATHFEQQHYTEEMQKLNEIIKDVAKRTGMIIKQATQPAEKSSSKH